MSGEEPTSAPALRIVRGEPDAGELAALVTVLAAASTAAAGPPTRTRSAWAEPARGVRAPMPAGGWRAPALPR